MMTSGTDIFLSEISLCISVDCKVYDWKKVYIRISLYLLLPRSELLKLLFAIYDRNQTYCFTFRDFLYIRATRAAPALEKLNVSKLFKVKTDQYLSNEENIGS